VILQRLLLAAGAAAATVAAAAIAMAALSFALFALLRPYVGPAGAAAIVAAVYALFFVIGALIVGRAARGLGRRDRRAAQRDASRLVDRLAEAANDRPLVAAGVALALGVVLLRSPKSLAAVVSGVFDSLTGRTTRRR
jgi:MFS family permease